MSKILKFDGVDWFGYVIDQFPVDTDKYEDVTEQFISQYRVRQGFYQPSTTDVWDATRPNTSGNWVRFVFCDLVLKTDGEYIVQSPDNAETYRIYLSPQATWTGTNGGAYAGPNNLATAITLKNFHVNTNYMFTLKAGQVAWAFNFGVGSGTYTLQDALNGGLKIYKKREA